jgi:hypothetical protein
MPLIPAQIAFMIDSMVNKANMDQMQTLYIIVTEQNINLANYWVVIHLRLAAISELLISNTYNYQEKTLTNQTTSHIPVKEKTLFHGNLKTN